jgi:hypothetical protein
VATPQSETSAAAGALSAMVFEREMQRLATWLETRTSFPVAWQQAAIANASLLYLTLPELKGIGQELETLIGRFLGRLADPAERPEGARPVALLALGYPVEPTPSGG